MDLTKITDRSQLGVFLNQNNLIGTGVEVGSKSGGFAYEIMAAWRGRQLFMIDPWVQQDPAVYRERQDWTNFEDCYKECQKLEKLHAPRVALIRGYSPAESKHFMDGELDFVYIDGNHAGDAVSADLAAWWPKVKKGGLFAGHDCYHDEVWPSFCQVKPALDTWCKDMGLTYHHTPLCTSWWIEKT
jgi:hypothetical protein